MDQCKCIAPENRIQVVEKSWIKNQDNIKLITERYFESVAETVKRHRRVVTYKTSFYHGSSGSPVFDKDCNVLAMHSGGHEYIDQTTDTTKSVIDFGYPLSDIIEHIIIQLVERERFEVLKAFLASDHSNVRKTMSNVKKLVESRNLKDSKLLSGDQWTTRI